MNKTTLKRIRKKIDKLRRSGTIQDKDLISLAKSLGRTKRKSRGPHRVYETTLPGRRQVSIPTNPAKYTAESILDDLEADLDVLESMLNRSTENRNGR